MKHRTLRYRIYLTIWEAWHMGLRRFFDRFDAHLRGKDPNDWMYGVRYAGPCRPWWHLCCNGDAGGWRTHLCDHLEHAWRDLEDEQ